MFVGPMLLLVPDLAQARKFGITIAPPERKDFGKAVAAAKAVDRQVPMVLQATNQPQVKIVADKQGNLHQRSAVVVDVPYEQAIARLNPRRWSPNLYQRWGGEVKEVMPQKGGAAFQQERMSVGLPPLDMTKNVVVAKNKKGTSTTVLWQVTHSDKTPLTFGQKTVLQDDGWIRFSKTADGKTLIEARSLHNVSTLPSVLLAKVAPKLTAKITARGLKDYWMGTITKYKAIIDGQRNAVE